MESLFENGIDFIVTLTIIVVMIGFTGFVLALLLFLFGAKDPKSVSGRIKEKLMLYPAHNIGIPSSALSSFALVAVLWKVFPPETTDNGLVLKFFSLEFSGPSGPITLWVMCFLTLVFAIKYLRH